MCDTKVPYREPWSVGPSRNSTKIKFGKCPKGAANPNRPLVQGTPPYVTYL